MLKYAVLGFLNYFPMTGYDLKQIMDQSITNFWFAEQSQIYITMKKLEEEDLVTSQLEKQTGRPNRRVYTITKEGQAQLQKWLAEPVMQLNPYKEVLLLKLFFSARVDKQQLLSQLNLLHNLHVQQAEHYRTETTSVIQQYALSNPDWQCDAVLWDSTRRFGLGYEELYIRWLDETITRIKNEF